MLIDQGLDTGPLLLSRAVPISPEETAGALEARLAPVGAQLLLETLDGLASGTLVPVAQDEAAATLAPLIRKAEGRIDWRRPAEVLERRVRGFHPWPGTTCRVSGRDVKILRARVSSLAGPAGTVLRVDKDGLVVGCGEGSLVLLQVQPESGRSMSAVAFAAGARIAAGARLDDAAS
jgi:methionyl-tRNA formyltransferase